MQQSQKAKVQKMDEIEVRNLLNDKENIEHLFPCNIILIEQLAKGGQGIVYKGSVSGIEAAIKVYFPGQVQLRIERETEALVNLNDPHIVKLLWTGTILVGDIELQSVATSLVPGTSLSNCLVKGYLSHQEIGMVAYDITQAISSMWDLKIVHRDIKPDNILIKPDHRACVIDLGIARHIERTPLTATGFTWGTEGYMSPEQTRAAKQLTCKSDIFALGIILVECSLGRHPTRRDQMRLLTMSLHENLPIEIKSWEHAPLLKKMLDPKPIKRPLPKDILIDLSRFSTN